VLQHDCVARAEAIRLHAKKKTLRASEQDRPEVKKQRKAWEKKLRKIDPNRLVFLDESGAKTNMTRQYGRTLQGKRLFDAVPGGQWNSTTMIAAIRLEGVATAMITEGATNTLVFHGFVEQFLTPALRPGDIVVMDNLSSHKASCVIEAIEAVGAEAWFLPPYSPDFNPIELMWSKVKGQLRSIAARTKRTLVTAIGKALKIISQQDIAGWFAHDGYGISKC
jgi:transposase